MTEVVAALIWKGEKFMICQRPAHKARGLLWEFVGGKIEKGESGEEALTRECREELGCEVRADGVFMDVVHEYPDLTVHLTVYHASVVSGEVQKLEHNDIRYITRAEIPDYDFCPADKDILEKIVKENELTNADVRDFLRDYMSVPEHNTLKEMDLPAFDLPEVGFSSAADALYPFYKKHIDENFYRLPTEWLRSAYGEDFDPEEVSVISWVLPQTEDTRDKSRAMKDCPPMEWQHARVHGEECNRALAAAVEKFFRDRGIPAVAPMIASDFSWGESDKFTLVSNWSERHTAFISGLGTFGLCDGLISLKGKAARYGSVIVKKKFEPTERKYTEYNEYCQAKNGCTACMARCPAGAITPAGHDKKKCMAYHKEVITPLLKERYGYEGYAVCGLCQTGVPCECGIPTR